MLSLTNCIDHTSLQAGQLLWLQVLIIQVHVYVYHTIIRSWRLRYVHAKVCFINKKIKFLKRILLYSFFLLSVSFNSHNCDENARRVSEDKEYILTWLGKTDPRLCSFNFTGGSTDESHSVYKVCFQSVDIELPPFDMFLVVSNDSKKWVSMRSITLIRSTIYL